MISFNENVIALELLEKKSLHVESNWRLKCCVKWQFQNRGSLLKYITTNTGKIKTADRTLKDLERVAS